jgi:hypothetical protein
MVFPLKRMNFEVVMDEKETKNRIYSSSSKDEGEKCHNRQKSLYRSFRQEIEFFYAATR